MVEPAAIFPGAAETRREWVDIDSPLLISTPPFTPTWPLSPPGSPVQGGAPGAPGGGVEEGWMMGERLPFARTPSERTSQQRSLEMELRNQGQGQIQTHVPILPIQPVPIAPISASSSYTSDISGGARKDSWGVDGFDGFHRLTWLEESSALCDDASMARVGGIGSIEGIDGIGGTECIVAGSFIPIDLGLRNAQGAQGAPGAPGAQGARGAAGMRDEHDEIDGILDCAGGTAAAPETATLGAGGDGGGNFAHSTASQQGQGKSLMHESPGAALQAALQSVRGGGRGGGGGGRGVVGGRRRQREGGSGRQVAHARGGASALVVRGRDRDRDRGKGLSRRLAARRIDLDLRGVAVRGERA